MKKEQFEELINIMMSTNADFGEIFYEETNSKTYIYIDSKLDKIGNNNIKGIGFRLIKDDEVYYSSTNNLNYNNLKEEAKKLANNLKDKSNSKIKLSKLIKKDKKVKVKYDDITIEEKKELMNDINNTIRSYSNLITQVQIMLYENTQYKVIVNSTGKYISSTNNTGRIIIRSFAEKDGIKTSNSYRTGSSNGYDYFNKKELIEEGIKTAISAIEQLDATDFEGGEVPVIIENGFGGVIIHEACVHGLEATSVSRGLSIFKDDLNKKIGNEKLTVIDDGTLIDEWGTSLIDDEGNLPMKNILIENGILKQYLVDYHNENIMNQKSNGCGRRQNYNYNPTSRMSNTFIKPGNDSIEDMFKSIKYGIYCKDLSGGMVNPSTGDFNFGADEAFLIENGKITKRVKGITLIGTSKEIIKRIDMIANDLKLNSGYCGSRSGSIPTTCGQPTIRVSKMLVGGRK